MNKLTTAIKDRVSGKVPLLKKRSSRWYTVRSHFLIKNSSCAACGQTDHLQVHHSVPFHIDPTKELDESNLITLCEDEYDCHRIIGHTGNFRKENPSVREDAAKELAKHKANR
jgi:5-methylcytosine-specific restriction endonuclease McrA